MTTNQDAPLYILGDRGQTIDGSTNDLRGREVNDKHGNDIGKVADLLVDDQEHKIRFLLVEHGGFLGFGRTKTLIPIDAVTTITEHDIVLDQTREHVAAAPGYDPDLVDDRPQQASIYSHYGFEPYWGVGYMTPMNLDFPMSTPRPRD